MTTTAFLVTTTIQPADRTTLGVDGSCTEINTITLNDIGTWVSYPIPRSVFYRVITITATENHTDLKRTVDGDKRLRYRSRVTTAIDTLYTGLITTFNQNLRVLAISRQVVCHVTTTIHRVYLIMAILMTTAILRNGSFHIHHDVTLRCAIGIVGTEHTTIFGNKNIIVYYATLISITNLLLFISSLLMELGAVHGYRHVTIDHGSNSRNSICSLPAQRTTIGITHETARQIDRGLVSSSSAWIVLSISPTAGTTILRCIPVIGICISQSTAAIDIVDDSTATHGDSHVLLDVTQLTAAIDVTICGTATDSYTCCSFHLSGFGKCR